MLENSLIQMSTSKLVAAAILPNSILLITGIVIWRFWRKQQTKLQTTTDELKNEIKHLKKQMDNIQVEKHKDPPLKPSNKQTDSAQIGLFEFLIEDNIQLRKHT